MKVLVCIPCLLTGGTEIQTLNLVQALVLGGHQVTTVCYFEHNDLMIQNYKEAGSDVVLLNSEGKRIGGWKGILFLFKGLRKVVQEYHPDVAHVQYMAPGALPILLLKILGVKNVIATAHTPADIYPSLNLLHFIQKHCLRAFTCITQLAEQSFFQSSHLYDPNFKLKRHNHFTIYNALPSYVTIRKDKKNFGEILTLGVVSRMESIKGMDLVVPAFALLAERYSNIRLLVVGDGELLPFMKEQVEHEKLSDRVTFVGRQGQSELQYFYDKIDILCMPSRSEGFGLTAIEGMARGCVVVAANTGGLPEVVKDGKVGMLHEKENIASMVDSTSLLIKDRVLLKNLSDEAVKYVEKYSFSTYSCLFNSLYTKLL